MGLHDDRNQIFGFGTGSSISVGELSTRCASLRRPGCLGRKRSQGNTENSTQRPGSATPCSFSVKNPPKERKCSSSFIIRLEIKRFPNVTLRAADKTCFTFLKASWVLSSAHCSSQVQQLHLQSQQALVWVHWHLLHDINENSVKNVWSRNPVPMNIWRGFTLINVRSGQWS